MESIDVLNQRLKDIFGYFDGINPNYRVAWSEDLYEKRLVDHTDEGFQLSWPEFREVRKYNYIKERYILEKLVPIPETGHKDLDGKLSYEAIWTFEDIHGNPLPPIWIAIEKIITNLHEKMGKKTIYKDEELDPGVKEAKFKELYESLYGNETDVTDALAYGSGVSIPHNYEKVN